MSSVKTSSFLRRTILAGLECGYDHECPHLTSAIALLSRESVWITLKVTKEFS